MSRSSIKDPMLHAAAEVLYEHPDHLRWLSYADDEMARLRELCGLPTPTGYAQGVPNYPSDDRCSAVSGIGADYRCQLPKGHNSPHENTDSGSRMTWEPRYVADLRRELEDLRREATGSQEARS